MQKMSTLHPSLESRTKLLKEIAAENKIALHLDGPSVPTEVFQTGILSVNYYFINQYMVALCYYGNRFQRFFFY